MKATAMRKVRRLSRARYRVVCRKFEIGLQSEVACCRRPVVAARHFAWTRKLAPLRRRFLGGGAAPIEKHRALKALARVHSLKRAIVRAHLVTLRAARHLRARAWLKKRRPGCLFRYAVSNLDSISSNTVFFKIMSISNGKRTF